MRLPGGSVWSVTVGAVTGVGVEVHGGGQRRDVGEPQAVARAPAQRQRALRPQRGRAARAARVPAALAAFLATNVSAVQPAPAAS